jgi:hypothetical protein
MKLSFFVVVTTSWPYGNHAPLPDSSYDGNCTIDSNGTSEVLHINRIGALTVIAEAQTKPFGPDFSLTIDDGSVDLIQYYGNLTGSTYTTTSVYHKWVKNVHRVVFVTNANITTVHVGRSQSKTLYKQSRKNPVYKWGLCSNSKISPNSVTRARMPSPYYQGHT